MGPTCSYQFFVTSLSIYLLFMHALVSNTLAVILLCRFLHQQLDYICGLPHHVRRVTGFVVCVAA